MVEYSFRRRKSKIAILVFKQDETFSNISDDVIQPVVSTYQITPGNDVGHDETKLRLWEITAGLCPTSNAFGCYVPFVAPT
ncbi:MAG: hypothetical protein QXF61_10180 [Nitrososphaeria archaeon]